MDGWYNIEYVFFYCDFIAYIDRRERQREEKRDLNLLLGFAPFVRSAFKYHKMIMNKNTSDGYFTIFLRVIIFHTRFQRRAATIHPKQTTTTAAAERKEKQ